MNNLRVVLWCARVDSNHWPFAPEANGVSPQVTDSNSGQAGLSRLVQFLVQGRCYPPTSLPVAAVSR
jgi:hypothetical protein